MVLPMYVWDWGLLHTATQSLPAATRRYEADIDDCERYIALYLSTTATMAAR